MLTSMFVQVFVQMFTSVFTHDEPRIPLVIVSLFPLSPFTFFSGSAVRGRRTLFLVDTGVSFLPLRGLV